MLRARQRAVRWSASSATSITARFHRNHDQVCALGGQPPGRPRWYPDACRGSLRPCRTKVETVLRIDRAAVDAYLLLQDAVIGAAGSEDAIAARRPVVEGELDASNMISRGPVRLTDARSAGLFCWRMRRSVPGGRRPEVTRAPGTETWPQSACHDAGGRDSERRRGLPGQSCRLLGVEWAASPRLPARWLPGPGRRRGAGPRPARSGPAAVPGRRRDRSPSTRAPWRRLRRRRRRRG
jgi:hypothetical protein